MTVVRGEGDAQEGRVRRRIDGSEGAGGGQLRGERRRRARSSPIWTTPRPRSKATPAPWSPRADAVRVVTYNVRGFRDGLGRVAAVVRELAPDVLLLQETGSRRDLRRFAAEVGMRAARDPWSPLRRRVKNAVLLAEPWSLVSFRLERFADARRWYPRGALVARASTGSGDIWAISIHLGLDGAERARQAERVTRRSSPNSAAGWWSSAATSTRRPTCARSR